MRVSVSVVKKGSRASSASWWPGQLEGGGIYILYILRGAPRMLAVMPCISRTGSLLRSVGRWVKVMEWCIRKASPPPALRERSFLMRL